MSEWTPERILALRGALGIKQSELAEMIGVNAVTICRWENGKNKPTTLAVRRLEAIEKKNKPAADE